MKRFEPVDCFKGKILGLQPRGGNQQKRFKQKGYSSYIVNFVGHYDYTKCSFETGFINMNITLVINKG